MNYNTNVKITRVDVDWLRIKSACMTTISKQAGCEPSREWKRKLLICQHSPIRRGVVSWKWEEIPYAISPILQGITRGVKSLLEQSGLTEPALTGRKEVR